MFDNFILYLLRHVCLSTYTGFWESGIASLGIAVQVVQEACSGWGHCVWQEVPDVANDAIHYASGGLNWGCKRKKILCMWLVVSLDSTFISCDDLNEIDVIWKVLFSRHYYLMFCGNNLLKINWFLKSFWPRRGFCWFPICCFSHSSIHLKSAFMAFFWFDLSGRDWYCLKTERFYIVINQGFIDYCSDELIGWLTGAT